MDQPPDKESQADIPRSFIFTNSNGHVIFSDQRFSSIMGDMAARILSGVALHNIFPMDVRAESQLVEAVRKKLIVENLSLSYRSPAGEVVQSDCTAVGSIDENGNFLGADLVLKPGSQAGSIPGDPDKIKSHADVVRAYVELVMNSRNPFQPRTFTQSYLVAQFSVLQVILARMGGPTSRSIFEKIANGFASSMALPIFMENGHLNFTKKNIDIQSYRSLLNATVNYAVNVIGKNIVKREMLLVDKFVGPGTLELISQMDLRIFSPDFSG